MTEDQKAALIERYRDINVRYEWWDATYDNFAEICKILCIELDKNEPSFSGFWSQGDGASFTGHFSPYGVEKAPALMREHAPKDEELHRIADKLCEINLIYFAKFYGDITRSGYYCHSHTMGVEIVVWDEDEDEDYWPDEVFSIVEETFLDLMRDLADWLYKTLEAEYYYLTSDEAVWDAIEANELDEVEEE